MPCSAARHARAVRMARRRDSPSRARVCFVATLYTATWKPDGVGVTCTAAAAPSRASSGQLGPDARAASCAAPRLQHDRVDAVAEVEVALEDGADRVAARAADRQHDDPRLGAGIVGEADADAARVVSCATSGAATSSSGERAAEGGKVASTDEPWVEAEDHGKHVVGEPLRQRTEGTRTRASTAPMRVLIERERRRSASTSLRPLTLPSRRMRKRLRRAARRSPDGLNCRAICRTTFCRYTGYGNSIPSVRTFATSAPRPPTGPPPAARRGRRLRGVGVPALGVAVFGVRVGRRLRGGAFMRSGSGVARASGAGAGGVGVGAGSGGASRTTPIWRGPGGAAIERHAVRRRRRRPRRACAPREQPRRRRADAAARTRRAARAARARVRGRARVTSPIPDRSRGRRRPHPRRA